jgi:ERCC4-type nuclease
MSKGLLIQFDTDTESDTQYTPESTCPTPLTQSCLCIDTRERDIISSIGNSISISIRQLPIADFWIGVSGDTILESGLLIERKTVKDLEASILDGRYRDQRTRLVAHAQQMNAHPVYIIEGNLQRTTGRLQKKALQKIINRLVIAHGIPVFYTANIKETVELLIILEEQYRKEPTDFYTTVSDTLRSTDGIHVQKKQNASQPKHFTIACLAQCPGISVKMAEQIVNTLGHFENIMNASEKEMECIKVNSRKIGPAVAKRLYELLHSSDNTQ